MAVRIGGSEAHVHPHRADAVALLQPAPGVRQHCVGGRGEQQEVPWLPREAPQDRVQPGGGVVQEDLWVGAQNQKARVTQVLAFGSMYQGAILVHCCEPQPNAAWDEAARGKRCQEA